jgi:endonuclease-3
MARESKKAKRERAEIVLERLDEAYPDATTELSYETPFHLLIATILSAQATDVSVNAATPGLFEAYPEPSDLAEAEPEDVEPHIQSIGLYKTKAKRIVGTAQKIVAEHQGRVPDDFDALLELPGVGRKTANVVMANAFGRPAIAVDTHVGRLARRLGFSQHDDPDKVERDLEALFPEDRWIFMHHALILHGRRVCHSRKPECEACSLSDVCPSSRVAAFDTM